MNELRKVAEGVSSRTVSKTGHYAAITTGYHQTNRNELRKVRKVLDISRGGGGVFFEKKIQNHQFSNRLSAETFRFFRTFRKFVPELGGASLRGEPAQKYLGESKKNAFGPSPPPQNHSPKYY